MSWAVMWNPELKAPFLDVLRSFSVGRMSGLGWDLGCDKRGR